MARRNNAARSRNSPGFLYTSRDPIAAAHIISWVKCNLALVEGSFRDRRQIGVQNVQMLPAEAGVSEL